MTMTTIHYPAKHYSTLKRDQLVQLAYALEDQRDRALRKLDELQQPEPTWRDVKLAAHRAGYRVTEHKSFGSNFDHWRIIGGDTGKRYVTLVHERGEWKLSFSGPTGTVHLRDIDPARVLEAARFVGLDGAGS